MIDPNDPAFYGRIDIKDDGSSEVHVGLTKLEYMSTAIMGNLLGSGERVQSMQFYDIAALAVKAAEELIGQLNERARYDETQKASEA